MPRLATLLIGVALYGLAAAPPAAAQASGGTLCHDHGKLSQALLERYREQPVSIGLQTDGRLLQVYASSETGTWTILVTRPDGISCILAAGKHYEQRPLAPLPPTASFAAPDRDG